MAINAETENSSLIWFNVNNKGDDAFKTQMLQTFLNTNTNNDIVLNTQLILEHFMIVQRNSNDVQNRTIFY